MVSIPEETIWFVFMFLSPMFTKPFAKVTCPMYPILGNHDYEGNIDAQIKYSMYVLRMHMKNKYYYTVNRML